MIIIDRLHLGAFLFSLDFMFDLLKGVMAVVSAFAYLICRKFSKWAKDHLE